MNFLTGSSLVTGHHWSRCSARAHAVEGNASGDTAFLIAIGGDQMEYGGLQP